MKLNPLNWFRHPKPVVISREELKIKWTTTRDLRTRGDHALMSGNVYLFPQPQNIPRSEKITGARPRFEINMGLSPKLLLVDDPQAPPAHLNCRCASITWYSRLWNLSHERLLDKDYEDYFRKVDANGLTRFLLLGGVGGWIWAGAEEQSFEIDYGHIFDGAVHEKFQHFFPGGTKVFAPAKIHVTHVDNMFVEWCRDNASAIKAELRTKRFYELGMEDY